VTFPPPCLASAPAFLAAAPADLAAAALYLGFSDQLQEPIPGTTDRELFQRLVGVLALVPFEPQSMKWFAAIEHAEVQFYGTVMYEGVIFAEQRLCLWRDAPFGDSSGAGLTLLRRGRAFLTTGDAATYLS
jgi:hypothetical protein